jgi:hypothetical protein
MRMAFAMLLAVSLASCQRRQVSIVLGFDAGVGSCADVKELSCVNFIRFELRTGRDEPGEGQGHQYVNCVPLMGTRFETLCDVSTLGMGQELFRRSPDEEVELHIAGLSHFPMTSCENLEACPDRVVFRGRTARVRLGDLIGGSVPLIIHELAPGGCGLGRYVIRPQLDGGCSDAECESGGYRRLVCPVNVSEVPDIDGFCVCEAKVDGGLEEDAGP